jgi:GST-like protein
MFKFYYHPAPNPAKVALCLEEMGFEYEPLPVDTKKGEQFSAELLAVNPNGKTPALIDEDNGARLFDSNAILLYLAEKSGQFLPNDTLAQRGEMFSWLMFIATGVGPYSGQAVHFTHFAPESQEYSKHRYQYEVTRHYTVLEERLREHHYMLGERYTIVDMALWGWAGPLPFIQGDDVWDRFPNVKRLFDEISARPAAQRALALRDRFTFKQEMDEEARRNMFPQNFAASA